MKFFVVDFETFYDSKAGYTLKKMTTEEYINDKRFHAFGFSVLRDGGNPIWVPEEKIEYMLRQLKLEENALIAHNAPFDVAILTWKYGIKPKFIIDTLAMARALYGSEASNSLSALAERLGVGVKGDAILHMDGIRHPSTIMANKLAEYAKQDARLEWKCWVKMRNIFPKTELVMVDLTTRMFTEPSFVLDRSKIQRELDLGEENKKRLLDNAGCALEDLRSDEKFANLLIQLGVEPPKKISAKKSAKAGHTVYTWAFAKSDADFKALQDHEDDMVRWAVEARLGLKTTIKQSRAERFLAIADRMGVMPVALDYAGANTHRYVATNSARVNMQNLPSARGQKGNDIALLRKSLRAPEGKMVVVSDLAQIEARLLVWQAGQKDVVEAFAQNRDVYSEMASKIFNRHVDRKNVEADFIPGFIGKSVVLGCGYQLGFFKFGSMIYSGMLGMRGILFELEMAEQLGVDVPEFIRWLRSKEHFLARAKEEKPAALTATQWIVHLACAQKVINVFRVSNPLIVDYWKLGQQILESMYLGVEAQIGLFVTRKDGLLLPNGMWMHFKELERDEEGAYSCLRRKEGRIRRVNMYGGKVVENLTQALAGIVVKEAMVRMYLRGGYRTILQVHDEVVTLVDKSKAEPALFEINSYMTEAPNWAIDLPLAAEGDFAESYGEAK